MYYSRAENPNLSSELNDITAQQTHGTVEIVNAITKLLKKITTYRNTSIIYKISDIALHVDSDSSYLLLSKVRIRAYGH